MCVQVGSLSPGIEVWDLDILDAVEPIITLGGELPVSSAEAQEQQADEASNAKKSKKKSKVMTHALLAHFAYNHSRGAVLMQSVRACF